MSPEVVTFDVPDGAEGSRLDRFLTEKLPGTTRSAVGRLVREGAVRIDGQQAPKPGLPLKSGMQIVVTLPAPVSGPTPESIPLAVVYQDPHVVVVNKPAGLVVHAGHGRTSGTLVNALLGLGIGLSRAGGPDRPGIVHRLDQDTTGLLVAARTDEAFHGLSRAFAEREVRKRYRALVWGRPSPESGEIERSIGRSRVNPTRMSVEGIRGRARQAHTTYRTIETMPGFAWLALDLHTGRTHQIRVHLQSLHHPVVGDERYGGRAWRGVQDPAKRNALRDFRGLALHAAKLEFTHPVSGDTMRFSAPIPAELAELLDVLRGER